jgi:rhomboid protease GluP
MANCTQCGKEFPGTIAGEASELCVECRVRQRIEQQRAIQATRPKTMEMARMFPVTATLVAVNLLVYAACAIQSLRLGMGSPIEFDTRLLLRWGANFGPLTLDGQYWRIFTSMFLHGGLIHVGANMWCLWEIGRVAERVYGRYRMLTIYLLTGLASSVASLAMHPTTVSVGASGAIFGVVGALLFPFYRKRVVLPSPVLKSMLRSLVMFIFINLAIGAAVPFIDNAAHVGGLLSGLLLGVVSTHFATGESDLNQVFPRVAAVTAIAVGFAFAGLQHLHHDRLLPAQALLAIEQGNLPRAMERAQQAISKDPKNAMAHAVLGEIYWDKKQYSEAAQELQAALSLDPSNDGIAGELGSAYVALGKWSDAEPMLRRGLNNDGNDPALLRNLGITLAEEGRPDEAVNYLQKALQKDPQSAKAQYVLGSVLLQQKRTPEAIGALRAAVKLSPDNQDYKKMLAEAEEQIHSAGNR